METNLLLDTYLKQLRLPMFLQNYRKLAEEAAQTNHSYDRFLLALAEQEVAQREQNRITRRIKGARFPVLKELADFDFSSISSPNKQRVLELARGAYIHRRRIRRRCRWICRPASRRARGGRARGRRSPRAGPRQAAASP